MSFIATGDNTATTTEITNDDAKLPNIKLADFRFHIRQDTTVPDGVVLNHLQAGMDNVNREIGTWLASKTSLTDKQKRLYLTAVYHYAKAQMITEYQDFDSTGDNFTQAEMISNRIGNEWISYRATIRVLLGLNVFRSELI